MNAACFDVTQAGTDDQGRLGYWAVLEGAWEQAWLVSWKHVHLGRLILLMKTFCQYQKRGRRQGDLFSGQRSCKMHLLGHCYR